jgi:ribosomal protein S18 acetylase RimI-like enzyme
LSGLSVEREQTLGAEDAERFAAIYEKSFPASERDETADLLASVEAGERLCYLARLDGEVVGVAVALALDGPSVVFLEYLAVDPSKRNGGIGGTILGHLRAHLEADSGGATFMVFEVESPEEADGAERALRERRIGFYRRHAAAIVQCAPRYRAPNLERENETVPYVLLSVPLTAAAPAALSGERLRRCVNAILTQSYGLAPDDPLVREVVDDLAC